LTIKVRYYFTLEPKFSEVVTNRLEAYGVEIDSYESEKDPSHLIGTISISSENPLKIIDLMNVYYGIEGIQKIHADYNNEIDKRLWYKHPVFPMLISAGLTAATIFGVIYRFDLSLNSFDYMVILGIPTLTSFFTGVLHRFFS
jgi:hypothetical protein